MNVLPSRRTLQRQGSFTIGEMLRFELQRNTTLIPYKPFPIPQSKYMHSKLVLVTLQNGLATRTGCSYRACIKTSIIPKENGTIAKLMDLRFQNIQPDAKETHVDTNQCRL